MAINASSTQTPEGVMLGSVPPPQAAGRSNRKPPSERLMPVPTKTSTMRQRRRVMRDAKAEHTAFRMMKPSPSRVKCPLSAFPAWSAKMPAMPTAQPATLWRCMRSLLKKTQAKMTTRKTLSELRMAARAPSLCESPK